MKLLFVFTIFLFSVFTAYAQVPLKTIMEIEYVNSGYALGTGILGLGDINSDCKPDFAVSAGNIGKTFIYFGGKGVLDSVPDLIIKGGGKMAMGDLNGDGKKDLIVAGGGGLYIYFGKDPNPIAIDTIPDLFLKCDSAGGGEPNYGQSFAIGDINDNGFDDLIVSAPNYSHIGKVYIYLGKSALTNDPDFTAIGDSLCSFYGNTIKTGDINGDGIADLVIGSLIYSGCSNSHFELLDIYLGHRGWTFSKNNYSQELDSRKIGINNFGWFNLLDINGDRRADISITDSGKAYFFYGEPDSVRCEPSFIIQSDTGALGSTLGWPAVDIGDINDDGKRDFVLRASPGGPAVCIYVYLGGPYPSIQGMAVRCKGFVDGGTAFFNVAPVGDINGDGINDFAATVPFDALLGILPQDGYFAVFSGDTTLVTSVPKIQNTISHSNKLNQNYPNPFNTTTAMSYQLPVTSYISLNVYDILGRQTATLIDGMREPGYYSVTFDGYQLASGIYFARMTVQPLDNYSGADKPFVQVRKLLLIK